LTAIESALYNLYIDIGESIMKSIVFKGRTFFHCRNVVMMPDRDDSHNVYFGRVVPKGKDASAVKGAVQTNYTWEAEDENTERAPVFATPIELKGHSLTNMAYATDGYTYLAKDGKCYRAKARPLV
jgi:hypothetical protein